MQYSGTFVNLTIDRSYDRNCYWQKEICFDPGKKLPGAAEKSRTKNQTERPPIKI